MVYNLKFDRPLFPRIGSCIGAILSKVTTLITTIQAEAELRFAVADPIIEMIANTWGYKVTK